MRVAILLLGLFPTAPLFAGVEQPPAATQPADPAMASREARDQLVASARARMRQDREKYSAEQLKDAEDLYQIANKDWRSDGARAALKAMIEKYPDINRTGCAVLYMGQMSRDAGEAEHRFRQAIDDYSDCWYLNGAQVGGLARLYLAGKYAREGRLDEAGKLLDEIEQDYPNAIDHRGRLLSSHVRALRERMDQKKD